MLRVYYKNNNKIAAEERLNSALSRYSKSAQKPVCPTYIISNQQIIDTDSLSEDLILKLIENDIIDYINPQGTYYNIQRSLDSFTFIDIVKNEWIPSCFAVYQLALMAEKHGGIVMDLIGMADKNRFYQQAISIARFQKESAGDFSYITSEDIIHVLRQMAYNEQNRKNQIKSSR